MIFFYNFNRESEVAQNTVLLASCSSPDRGRGGRHPEPSGTSVCSHTHKLLILEGLYLIGTCKQDKQHRSFQP